MCEGAVDDTSVHFGQGLSRAMLRLHWHSSFPGGDSLCIFEIISMWLVCDGHDCFLSAGAKYS